MSLFRCNACSRIDRPVWPVIAVVFSALSMVGVAVAANLTSAGDAELFIRLDANQNGTIAADEVTSANRSLFERLLQRGDANHDKALSREEFLASLVPSRPEKPIVAKEPTDSPQADVVRYLLLELDANKNARIEKDEAPKELRPTLAALLERLDYNDDGVLDRPELGRGGPVLAQIAGRYVERDGIDVKSELAKFKKSQGTAANRFDETKGPLERLGDPLQASQVFKELDSDNDGYLNEKEMSAIFRERAERFTNMADRDRDGRLSEREFFDGAERVTKYLGRQMKDERKELKAKKNERKSKPAGSSAGDKNS